jgi:hypothetical protein
MAGASMTAKNSRRAQAPCKANTYDDCVFVSEQSWIGLPLLRGAAVRRNGLGNTEQGTESFKDDTTVENPEKIGEQRC